MFTSPPKENPKKQVYPRNILSPEKSQETLWEKSNSQPLKPPQPAAPSPCCNFFSKIEFRAIPKPDSVESKMCPINTLCKHILRTCIYKLRGDPKGNLKNNRRGSQSDPKKCQEGIRRDPEGIQNRLTFGQEKEIPKGSRKHTTGIAKRSQDPLGSRKQQEGSQRDPETDFGGSKKNKTHKSFMYV